MRAPGNAEQVTVMRMEWAGQQKNSPNVYPDCYAVGVTS